LCPYCFICCVSKHILLVVNIIGWHQPDKCTVMLDFKLQFCSLLQEAWGIICCETFSCYDIK
jgi:hypothetical protein